MATYTFLLANFLILNHRDSRDRYFSYVISYYHVYQLGTEGCTQEAEPVQGTYP